MAFPPIRSGLLPALLPLLMSGCATSPVPPPTPAPKAAPAPATTPPALGWRDEQLTSGTWRYQPGSPLSAARYGDPQSAIWVVQCDVATRRVTLMRQGSANEFVIMTSSRTARFPAGYLDDRGTPMSGVILNAADPFLDAMAYSRGRIAVASAGLPTLIVPAWAEPARAMEDCRK